MLLMEGGEAAERSWEALDQAYRALESTQDRARRARARAYALSFSRCRAEASSSREEGEEGERA